MTDHSSDCKLHFWPNPIEVIDCLVGDRFSATPSTVILLHKPFEPKPVGRSDYGGPMAALARVFKGAATEQALADLSYILGNHERECWWVWLYDAGVVVANSHPYYALSVEQASSSSSDWIPISHINEVREVCDCGAGSTGRRTVSLQLVVDLVPYLLRCLRQTKIEDDQAWHSLTKASR